MSCQEALAQDQFDEILVEYIEPHLGTRPIQLFFMIIRPNLRHWLK